MRLLEDNNYDAEDGDTDDSEDGLHDKWHVHVGMDITVGSIIASTSLLGLLTLFFARKGYLVLQSNHYFAAITNYSQAKLAGNCVLLITNYSNRRGTDCNALHITLPIAYTLRRFSPLRRG